MAKSIVNLINDVCSSLDGNVRNCLIVKLQGDGCFIENHLKYVTLQNLLERYEFPLILARELERRGLLLETHNLAGMISYTLHIFLFQCFRV